MYQCPECMQIIHRGAELCPHCGFSLPSLDEIFGKSREVADRLDDVAGLLRKRDRYQVLNTRKKFERQFPQLWWHIATCEIVPEGSMRKYGFWLLNRTEVLNIPEKRDRNGVLLLLIDPSKKQAGINWGYALDGYLEEEECFTALSRAHAYWMEEQYAAGIIRFIGEIQRVLRRQAARAVRRAQNSKRREETAL